MGTRTLTELRWLLYSDKWHRATPAARLDILLRDFVPEDAPWRRALVAARTDLAARRTPEARAWILRVLSAHKEDIPPPKIPLPQSLATALRELFLHPMRDDDRLRGIAPHSPCPVCGAMGYVDGCNEHQTPAALAAAHQLIRRALSTGGVPGLTLRHLPQEDWEPHWLSLGPDERVRAWAAIKADQKARHDKARQDNGKAGGRPTSDLHKIREAKRLAGQGRSQREIAKTVGVGVGTVNRWLKG